MLRYVWESVSGCLPPPRVFLAEPDREVATLLVQGLADFALQGVASLLGVA